MDTLIILLFAIPLMGVVLAALNRSSQADRLALPAISATLIVLVLMLATADLYTPVVRAVFSWNWLQGLQPPLSFGYQLDPLSWLLLTVVVVLGFLVFIFSKTYLSDQNREHPGAEGKARHHAWLLLFVVAMIGVAVSPNLLQLFFFWETTTLCSWALISHYRNAESLRAGFKALLMTFSGGIFFALGLVLLFVQTRSFEFSALRELPQAWRFWVFGCFVVAAWAKSAQVPFYTWLPDAMAAPTTVSMYLHAAAMVKAGVFLIARLTLANQELSFGAGVLLAAMAVVTMITALLLFFYQNDLKRLLAYSTIAHLSYVLFGLGLGVMGSGLGWYAGVMHIMNHSAAKGLLFLCVGAISYTAGTRRISELSGLARTAPLIAVAFFVGMLALLGVPPFSCFYSKFYLLTAAVNLGGVAGFTLLIPFILEMVVAFAWFLHIGHKVFFGPVSESAGRAANPPLSMSVVLILLMLLTLAAPYFALHLMRCFGL